MTAFSNFILITILQLTAKSNSLVLYDDGSSHPVTESINDAVNLKSSSTLLFSGSNYVIRAPKGSVAVRLYMSSTLNMTMGQIIGGDFLENNREDSEDNLIGAGVVVGSASIAEFHGGATVRGGSHVGEILTTDGSLNSFENEPNLLSGKGGDALVGLYFGSTLTIRGGNFIGGRGSSYGNSVHVAYDAQANIYGGSFQGSFLARDRGAIVAHGCLSRVGNRLVGYLENGDSIDVQLVEENGGKVIVEAPKFVEECSKYHRSSGVRLGLCPIIALNILSAIGGMLSLYI